MFGMDSWSIWLCSSPPIFNCYPVVENGHPWWECLYISLVELFLLGLTLAKVGIYSEDIRDEDNLHVPVVPQHVLHAPGQLRLMQISLVFLQLLQNISCILSSSGLSFDLFKI